MARFPVRLIIADAGPLIVLSRVKKLDLLRQVFGQVCITDTVRDELLAGGVFPGQAEIQAALADWVDVVTVDIGSWEPTNPDLGGTTKPGSADRSTDTSHPLGIWFPTIRCGTGTDVFTIRLAKALSDRDIRNGISWLPHGTEYAP